MGQQPLDTHRNRWIVEKQEFFDERAAAARRYGIPTSTPRWPPAAIRNSWGRIFRCMPRKSRPASFEILRIEEVCQPCAIGLADAVARGEPLPPVRLKEKAAVPTAAPVRSQARRRRRDEAPLRPVNKPPDKPARRRIDSTAAGSSRAGLRESSSLATQPSRGGSLLVGRLTEHGRANYQFRADENASYYLKLLTSQGAEDPLGQGLGARAHLR